MVTQPLWHKPLLIPDCVFIGERPPVADLPDRLDDLRVLDRQRLYLDSRFVRKLAECPQNTWQRRRVIRAHSTTRLVIARNPTPDIRTVQIDSNDHAILSNFRPKSVTSNDTRTARCTRDRFAEILCGQLQIGKLRGSDRKKKHGLKNFAIALKLRVCPPSVWCALYCSAHPLAPRYPPRAQIAPARPISAN